MTELRANATDQAVSAPAVEQNEERAWVAEELLAQPELGITRIQYVGLPEREAVHLLVTGRALGLQADASRREWGQVSITLAAPAQEALAAEGSGEVPRPARGLWSTMRASGVWIAGLLRRRTS